jgi:hypothetical protein
MAQVGVAVLNGEFSPRRILELEMAASLHGECIGAASPGGHRSLNSVSQGALTKPTFPTLARTRLRLMRQV